MDIKSRILGHFSSRADFNISDIDENQDLLESGLLDSLQLVDFIAWLENETQQPVDLDHLVNNDKITLKSAAAYLAKYRPI